MGLPPWAAYGQGRSRAAGDRGTAATGAGDRRCVSGIAWQAAEYHCGAGVLSSQRVVGISRSLRKVLSALPHRIRQPVWQTTLS
jgi:hypothetical protein